jgi:hypothetical protein
MGNADKPRSGDLFNITNSPHLRRSKPFIILSYYKQSAPTALDSFVPSGYYKQSAPTALDSFILPFCYKQAEHAAFGNGMFSDLKVA